jgi:hypothetical protein
MRKALLALTAAYAVLVAVPAMAGGMPSGGMPYCIKGCDFGGSGVGDCSFTSLAQCQATASGRVATCATNPYFNARAEVPADQVRMSRRKF